MPSSAAFCRHAGQNLIDLSFRTSQVADSDEHRLLMALRDSGLDDEAALETFCQTVTGALSSEDHYLILLAHERYDVPFKAKTARSWTIPARSFLRSVRHMPREARKAALRYIADEGISQPGRRLPVGAPELGFLFPAFDGRRTNLYNCLYYSRSLENNHRSWCRRCSSWTRPSLRMRKKSHSASCSASPLRMRAACRWCRKSMSSYARTLRHIKN